MGQVKVNFEKGVPFLPFDQLLSVLPPRSAYALPQAYAQLMLDEKSSIHDMYPQNFEIDIEGKRFMWQGICKVPYIDERRLLAETKELKKGLSESEAIRNIVKVDSLFVRSSSKLAEKICSLSLKSNKSDTSTSDGIGGIISLCQEAAEKPSTLQIEDIVFYVNYELPADGNNHIPHLLSGVNFPDKTIFEEDIMETVLWHERQQYGRPQYSRFENCQNEENWRKNGESDKRSAAAERGRSYLANAAPPSADIVYKGAGVGWGSGRGKQDRGVEVVNERMSSFSPFRKDGGSYNHHQRSQSETMSFGRGRGRGGRFQQNSNNGYTWRAVSSNTTTLRPQWNGAKDQSRW